MAELFCSALQTLVFLVDDHASLGRRKRNGQKPRDCVAVQNWLITRSSLQKQLVSKKMVQPEQLKAMRSDSFNQPLLLPRQSEKC